jgi:single-stranded DNA-binding protein
MNKIIITGAVISRGFGTQPAIHFSENGNCARFKIGQRVYDKRAENNYRWLNLSVKAFGALAERISKMGLKEGSCVNIVGRLDEDTWEDKDSGAAKRQFIIILDEIEYALTGEKKPSAAESESPPGEFTGYEAFSGSELY